MKFLKELALGAVIAVTASSPAFAAASPTPMATLLPSTAPAMSTQPRAVGEVPLSMTVVTYRAVAYGERASKVIGATVYNEDKQAVGRVADLVINPKDSVSIVIVSVGGFLGLGSKYVAVSAREFTFEKNRVLLPRATKQVLQQLPAFHFSK